MRIVRRDPADPRTDGENHLDHLVQRGLVACRTKRAMILFLLDRLEGRRGIQHASTAWAQHVPRHVEQADPRSMQQHGDRGLLAQIEPGGEVERIDAAERSVLAFEDKVFERGDRVRVGRTAKSREQGFGFAHETKPSRTVEIREQAATRAFEGCVPCRTSAQAQGDRAKRKDSRPAPGLRPSPACGAALLMRLCQVV